MKTGLGVNAAQKAVLLAVKKPNVLGDNPSVLPRDIAALSMVWHCIQLMQALARDFPVRRISTDVLELDKDELFNAMKVLSLFYKKSKDGKTFKETSWNDKWDDEVAHLPGFDKEKAATTSKLSQLDSTTSFLSRATPNIPCPSLPNASGASVVDGSPSGHGED